MIDIKTKKGFTLAEVLITLVVIGVIAAMTIPSLIASYRRQQVANQLKKSYSTIAQALNRAVADYGFYDGWEDLAAANFANKYLYPYLQIMKKCGPNSTDCFDYIYYSSAYATRNWKMMASDYTSAILSDGTSIAVRKGTGYGIIYIDINGLREPNTWGYDVFVFQVNIGNREPLGLVDDSSTTNRSSLISSCRTIGSTCTSLIYRNNWQIPDDYPLNIK